MAERAPNSTPRGRPPSRRLPRRRHPRRRLPRRRPRAGRRSRRGGPQGREDRQARQEADRPLQDRLGALRLQQPLPARRLPPGRGQDHRELRADLQLAQLEIRPGERRNPDRRRPAAPLSGDGEGRPGLARRRATRPPTRPSPGPSTICTTASAARRPSAWPGRSGPPAACRRRSPGGGAGGLPLDLRASGVRRSALARGGGGLAGAAGDGHARDEAERWCPWSRSSVTSATTACASSTIPTRRTPPSTIPRPWSPRSRRRTRPARWRRSAAPWPVARDCHAPGFDTPGFDVLAEPALPGGARPLPRFRPFR